MPGLYTDFGGGLSKVIVPGDILDGEEVEEIFLSPDGLSNGAVAFGVRFTDGTKGIYLAQLEGSIPNVVINFDQDAAGNEIAHLERIDDEYAAWGVQFTGGYYAARTSIAFPGYSVRPSLNYLCTFGGTAGGGNPDCLLPDDPGPAGPGDAPLGVVLDFSAEFVSIEAYTRNDGVFDSDGLALEAFDNNDVSLGVGTVTCTNDPAPFTTEGVCVGSISAEGIRRVEIRRIDFPDALDTMVITPSGVTTEPDIEVTPPSLEFGEVAIADSAVQSVTVENVGMADLTLSAVDITNGAPPFEITDSPTLPTVVAPAGSITVDVTFTPTATGAVAGSLEIASDDTDEPTVTVPLAGTGVPAPEAPVLDPIGDLEVDEGQTVDVPITASDANDDPLEFTVSGEPGFTSLVDNGDGTATLTLMPDFEDAGSYPGVTVVVSDGALTDEETFTIDVVDVNRAPSVDDQAVSTVQDTPVAVTLTGSDPDGDALTFAVENAPTNGTLSGTAPNLTYTPNPGYVGPDSFTFSASDGDLTSPPATVSITVEAADTALELKRSGLVLLEALADQISNRALDRAIRHLTASLDPSLWLDETHLAVPAGRAMFRHDRQALRALARIADIYPQAQLTIDLIVAADRQLAAVAIEEAITGGGDPALITRAQTRFAEAEAAVAAGNYTRAVVGYGRAWRDATAAL